jgi:hypothetical protein
LSKKTKTLCKACLRLALEAIEHTEERLLKFVKMKLKIVNRKYIINRKWFKYQRMKGIKDLGFKITIGRYELRFYKEKF